MAGTDVIWRAIRKNSFAVVSYVTPSGEPRSSGVVYAEHDRRLYVAVSSNSWKARHIRISGQVAVTVTVRRGGLLSLLTPIPPATVSFHGTATVHAATSPEGNEALTYVARLLPPRSRAAGSIVEIRPEGHFVTYGIGVALLAMRDPAASRGRVSVT